MIRFQCPHCRTALQADEELAGRSLTCSHCRQKLRVPGKPTSTAGRVVCVCAGCKATFAAASKPQPHRVQCPKCGTRMQVPGADQVTADGETLRFTCERCGQAYCVLAKYAGKKFGCLACKSPCRIPQLPKPEPEPAAAGLDILAAGPPPGWEEDLAADLEAAQQRKQPQEPEEAAGFDVSAIPMPPRASGFKSEAGGGSSRLTESWMSKYAVPLGITGFYIVLVIGAFIMAATSGDPPDKTSEAIRFSRQTIHDACRGKLNMPTNLAGLIELVEEGVPEEERAVMVALAGDVAKMDSEVTYKNLGHGGSGWVIQNIIEYAPPEGLEGPGQVCRATLAVTEFLDDFRCKELVVQDSDGELLATLNGVEAPDVLPETVEAFVAQYELPPHRVMLYLLIVAVILALILVISYWRVYEMGDEPGWACLVPVYNMVCLARIGNRPTVVGLLCGVAPLLPVLGTFGFLLLHAYIAIGVAQHFNRGTLFGLGLVFLPFIFYPTLAFSEPAF